MTEEQKQMIRAMRAAGATISDVAAALGISVNTVKSHCRRERQGKDYCKHCAAALVQVPNGRNKKFCSDKCRHVWWNKHRDQMKRRAVYPITCAGCDEVFESYGNRGRKYCSHPCYVRSRWPEQR